MMIIMMTMRTFFNPINDDDGHDEDDVPYIPRVCRLSIKFYIQIIND